MKVNELRTGLYFSIDYDNRMELKVMGIDINFKEPYFTAIKFKDEWYMINTNDFDRMYADTIDEYIDLIDKKQEQSYYNSSGILMKRRIKLTDKILDLFDFKFDLRDCKILTKREAEDYKWDEIFKVRLYREQNYPDCLYLVKKETGKNLDLARYNVIDEMKKYIIPPEYDEYTLEKTINKLKELETKEDDKLYIELVEYTNKIKEMTEELSNMKERFEFINPKTGKIRSEKFYELYEEDEE